MQRREFLALLGSAACAGQASAAPDITLRVAPVELEIAPGHIIKTTGYNGSVPGPLLRVTEGKPLLVEVRNDTKIPEFVHWHGLHIPSEVDGSMEEGTPAVPPHGVARYSFTPNPAGTRWYHSHGMAGRDLQRSTYSGQFGFLYVEPKNEPGRYDAEVFLALHGWDSYLSTMGDDEGGLEVVYKRFTVNGRSLGNGEPVRVREGQRVLFRILNASATKSHRLALPGHQFEVIALDGNAVPRPQPVTMLDLAPAERVDAIVTMNQPGVWVLGEVDDRLRDAGLGIVVEYANRSGAPQWMKQVVAPWDYTIFGAPRTASGPEIEKIPLVFRQKFSGNRTTDHWTVNGKSYPKTDPIRVVEGRRYRLIFDNQSDEAHPVHLHRHSFELTKVAGTPTGGVLKDVVVVPGRRQVEVEFTANHPGATLFHCHQQMHMDYGFMAMLEYQRQN